MFQMGSSFGMMDRRHRIDVSGLRPEDLAAALANCVPPSRYVHEPDILITGANLHVHHQQPRFSRSDGFKPCELLFRSVHVVLQYAGLDELGRMIEGVLYPAEFLEGARKASAAVSFLHASGSSDTRHLRREDFEQDPGAEIALAISNGTRSIIEETLRACGRQRRLIGLALRVHFVGACIALAGIFLSPCGIDVHVAVHHAAAVPIQTLGLMRAARQRRARLDAELHQKFGTTHQMEGRI